MKINNFIEEVEKLGIKLSKRQLEQLEEFYNLLIDYNEKVNLTRITEKEEVYLKHFYDSLTLIKAIDLTKGLTICDVGTGAGFPGIVLKICFPQLKVTLVETLQKRVRFLYLVKEKLNLKDLFICKERAEIFATNNRSKYDLVTSRAMARLNILNEMCIPLLKVNGYFIPMKGSIEGELEEASNSIKELNSELENVITFTLPIENSVRNLVIIKKTGDTKSKYPRRFSEIKNNPL
jgi:16S rRNA (guanine527-N7)-methyltransferase